MLDPPAGLLTLVPGELPSPDFGEGCALTPPELGLLVFVVVVELVLVCVFVVVVGVLVVLGDVEVDVDVVDVTDGVVVVAAGVVLLACFDPPQPAIASAAINAPES